METGMLLISLGFMLGVMLLLRKQRTPTLVFRRSVGLDERDFYKLSVLIDAHKWRELQLEKGLDNIAKEKKPESIAVEFTKEDQVKFDFEKETE